MLLVGQELLIRPDHPASDLWGRGCVHQFVVSFLCSILWTIICLFIFFLSIIASYVLFRLPSCHPVLYGLFGVQIIFAVRVPDEGYSIQHDTTSCTKTISIYDCVYIFVLKT